MINLTPHKIAVRIDGTDYVFEPSGKVARVTSSEVEVEALRYLDLNKFASVVYMPVIRRELGDVVDLPGDGGPFLVSSIVLSAIYGRGDVYAPDTGPTAIRDEGGNIVAVTRLVRAGGVAVRWYFCPDD